MYVSQDYSFKTLGSVDLHSQATVYARLAESEAIKTGSLESNTNENLHDEASLFSILPVSAESTGMLPERKGNSFPYLYLSKKRNIVFPIYQ